MKGMKPEKADHMLWRQCHQWYEVSQSSGILSHRVMALLTYAIAKPVEETCVTGFTDNGTRFQVQGFCLRVMAL